MTPGRLFRLPLIDLGAPQIIADTPGSLLAEDFEAMRHRH